jgi:hypothetical protein
LDKLVYTATNPVQDHLVDQVHHWPGGNGLGALLAGRCLRATRPWHFFRPNETMLYVHVAENHRREIPGPIVPAGQGENDPDRQILKMLAARGSHVAAASAIQSESRELSVP